MHLPPPSKIDRALGLDPDHPAGEPPEFSAAQVAAERRRAVRRRWKRRLRRRIDRMLGRR